MAELSEEVAEAFLSVFLDELNHALNLSAIAKKQDRRNRWTYLWHDRLAIITFHVSEGHLCALMLVDTKCWIVTVRDIVQRN